jgi:hypothetical protein
VLSTSCHQPSHPRPSRKHRPWRPPAQCRPDQFCTSTRVEKTRSPSTANVGIGRVGWGTSSPSLFELLADVIIIGKTNHFECRRLIARCADILLHFREEIHEAGDEVIGELGKPISKLTEYIFLPLSHAGRFTNGCLFRAFTFVYDFLNWQIHLPLWQRYLKRNDAAKPNRRVRCAVGFCA